MFDIYNKGLKKKVHTSKYIELNGHFYSLRSTFRSRNRKIQLQQPSLGVKGFLLLTCFFSPPRSLRLGVRQGLMLHLGSLSPRQVKVYTDLSKAEGGSFFTRYQVFHPPYNLFMGCSSRKRLNKFTDICNCVRSATHEATTENEERRENG